MMITALAVLAVMIALLFGGLVFGAMCDGLSDLSAKRQEIRHRRRLVPVAKNRTAQSATRVES